MDEITTCAESTVTELKHGELRTSTVAPEDFGVRRAKLPELQVSSPGESARVIREVLDAREGAPLDIVLMNAAFGLVAADRGGRSPQPARANLPWQKLMARPRRHSPANIR
jgi:anthranilate phosphoribosyltransferase